MAKRFLLDTHVVIEISTSEGHAALPMRVRRILEDPEVVLLLSVVSEAEVAIKNRIGKLALGREELATVCLSAAVESYLLRRPHVEQLFELPLHHNDPFDRLIIATALSDDLTVISKDEQFQKYRPLRVIW